ncbi:MAG: hypothetical protein L0287_03635 [Anaerolineae bacterium]|nr:hypothetical protein [Anaerolineae bacterium]MCI0610280.1 hypothetical protein [Anaerolineae bacterium]
MPEELRQDSDAAQWTTLLFDGFTSNDNNWSVGNRTSEYFATLNQTVADGRYRWEAEVGRPYSITTAWLMGYEVSDFHLTVNCKHISGSKAGSGWGVIFRVQDNQNFYWFRMTDQQFFAVSVKKDGQWHDVVDWRRTDSIKPNGVNQLEVIAHESHFIFCNCSRTNWLEQERQNRRTHQLRQFLKSALAVAFCGIQDSG